MASIHELVQQASVVREDWNGLNLLHDCASRVAALDLGFAPSATARAPGAPAPRFVYLLGADDYPEAAVPEGAFVVYQGHHGDRGAARADVVLPGAAYTEKSATYVNLEGRTQRTKAAVPVLGDAREDWRVLRAVSEALGRPLPYDTLDAVRARLAEVAPHLGAPNTVQPPIWLDGFYQRAPAAAAGGAAAGPLRTTVDNFFMTDAIRWDGAAARPAAGPSRALRRGSARPGTRSEHGGAPPQDAASCAARSRRPPPPLPAPPALPRPAPPSP
jgi:hypothetical protein